MAALMNVTENPSIDEINLVQNVLDALPPKTHEKTLDFSLMIFQ